MNILLEKPWILILGLVGVIAALSFVLNSITNNDARRICKALYAEARTRADTLVVDASRISQYANICLSVRQSSVNPER